jgi:hypothetical protein
LRTTHADQAVKLSNTTEGLKAANNELLYVKAVLKSLGVKTNVFKDVADLKELVQQHHQQHHSSSSDKD